jgi:hypothetical protein
MNWRLDWNFEILDKTLISDTTVTRLAGAENWTITCDIAMDNLDDVGLAANLMRPGSTVATVVLTAVAGNTYTTGAGGGIIRSLNIVFEPHGVYRATMVIECDSAITAA